MMENFKYPKTETWLKIDGQFQQKSFFCSKFVTHALVLCSYFLVLVSFPLSLVYCMKVRKI